METQPKKAGFIFSIDAVKKIAVNWFSNVVFDFLKRCISGKFKNNTD